VRSWLTSGNATTKARFTLEDIFDDVLEDGAGFVAQIFCGQF
jgi:hypothetical protein